MLRAFRQERQRDAEQSVKPEFFQHPGVEHRGGRRRRGVSFRRPGVKREERNQNAKADQQQEKNCDSAPAAEMPPLAATACSARRSKLRNAAGTLR